jgi:hypothetical protein
MGLNPSKFSLLLNQFFINSNNFINLINEILINNFPLKFLESVFINLEDLDLKFHFYVIILKKGSTLSTISKFLILPKGLFYSHLRSKLWINLCDKFIHIFFKNFYILKKFNYGIILLLLTYYLDKLIKIKLNKFINIIKFYNKEERLESIGNYFQFNNCYFKLYCKYNSKVSPNEHYFNYLAITDYHFFNLELKFYFSYFNTFNVEINKFLNLFDLIK